MTGIPITSPTRTKSPRRDALRKSRIIGLPFLTRQRPLHGTRLSGTGTKRSERSYHHYARHGVAWLSARDRGDGAAGAQHWARSRGHSLDRADFPGSVAYGLR